MTERLITKYIPLGDILIFVPGMKEIKRMSEQLEGFSNRYKVVELHSQYSESAYQELRNN